LASSTLVSLFAGPVDTTRQAVLAELHRGLDEGTGLDLKLGCVYLDRARLLDLEALHPTWSHGSLVQRILSGVARAELVRPGYAVFRHAPRGPSCVASRAAGRVAGDER